MSMAKLWDKLSRKSGDGSVVNEGDWCCAGCKQSWPESDKNKPELLGCCSCKGWFCRNCSKLKKADISVLGRNDIFWACGNCTTKVTLLLDNSPSPTVQEDELKRLTDTIAQQLKNLETKFENKIEQTIKDEIPKAVEKCMNQVSEKVDSSVACHMGKMEDGVSNKVGKCLEQVQEGVTASVEEKWTEVVGRKKKKASKDENDDGTLTTVVKRALLEQKTDEINRESRMKNFIVHRLPESTKDTPDERRKEENDKIKELLDTLGIQQTPAKLIRLGKYVEQKEGEKEICRPLKVKMHTSEAQENVMANVKKLNEAPQHIKNLSISYDMTSDERALVREKVEEAKEKTRQSKNWIYKVRGPFWNLREIRIRKED